MPGTYPAGPPTLSGDLETISRFLQSPTQIRRRLRDYTDLRFVADQILTQRFRTSGKVRVTDDEIARNVYAGQTVDRALRKTVNSIIQQVDGIAMSAVSSAVTATQAAVAAWSATATARILLDILLAKGKVLKLNLGYKPDTLLVDDNHYAYMMSDTAITNALRREDSSNPVYTGTIEIIAGLVIVVSPSAVAANPYVLDSQQLGGMADEMDAAPGYAMDQLAVQIKSIRQEGNDAWDLQGRRKTVPVVQEPGSACEVTGSGT